MKITINQQNKDIKPRPLFLKGVPFVWQDMKTMWFIRENFIGKKRTTAIAIYQTLTELASDLGRKRRRPTNQFPAHLKTIAERSGKSVSSIKRYALQFNKLDLISWESRRNGKMNMANIWKLHDFPGPYNNPTSIHNNELNPSGHNNELHKEERTRKYITKNRENYNFRNHEGFKPLKDLI